MTEIAYPNHEHELADKAARRRAITALEELAEQSGIMQRRLERGFDADGDDSQRLHGAVREVTQNLSIPGVLREVREWHAADMAAGEQR